MTVRFNTNNYLLTHGRQPRGTGSWAFILHERVETAAGWANQTRTVFAPANRTLTEAKIWCRHNAVNRDTVEVEVGA